LWYKKAYVRGKYALVEYKVVDYQKCCLANLEEGRADEVANWKLEKIPFSDLVEDG
jgi:hypothetical protein